MSGLTKQLLAPTSVGQTNRARVLQLLHRHGPASRAQLARELGVNRATVTTILQPLIERGVLREGEPRPSSTQGGKPSRPLWFAADGQRIGAMRIAVDRVSAALVGIDGTIHRRAARGVPVGAPASAYRAAIRQTSRRCFADADLLGIGVAASGMVDTAEGRIIAVHLAPVLNGFDVRAALSEVSVPVHIDHHPRVQALGDKWFGDGRQLLGFASVYTGEALGFGIVHGGEILGGARGAGGESGHTVVDMNGRQCLCGRVGCWETVATLSWLRERATELALPGAGDIDSARLRALVEQGHSDAAGLLDEYARNLAIGMADNEQILASNTYILHGDVLGGGEDLRDAIETWLVRFSPHREPAPSVVFARTPDDITLLGGAGLVLSAALATSV